MKCFPLWPMGACCMVLSLAGCAPVISPYSLQAYTNDTTMKADVLALVTSSMENYAAHTKDIAALSVKLSEAYEFARGEPDNAISTAQWNIILAPTGLFMAGFWRAGRRMACSTRSSRRHGAASSAPRLTG